MIVVILRMTPYKELELCDVNAQESIDIAFWADGEYIPGVPLSELREEALEMKEGGVWYYPDSGFVHVDTGRVKQW